MAINDEQLQTAVAKLGIGSYRKHVILCAGPKCCTPEDGTAAWEALKAKMKDAGVLADCQRTRAGCLRICCSGPVAVVYPEGTWYQGMTADKIERFVQEHLAEGKPIEEWIFARNPLGEQANPSSTGTP